MVSPTLIRAMAGDGDGARQQGRFCRPKFESGLVFGKKQIIWLCRKKIILNAFFVLKIMCLRDG